MFGIYSWHSIKVVKTKDRKKLSLCCFGKIKKKASKNWNKQIIYADPKNNETIYVDPKNNETICKP